MAFIEYEKRIRQKIGWKRKNDFSSRKSEFLSNEIELIKTNNFELISKNFNFEKINAGDRYGNTVLHYFLLKGTIGLEDLQTYHKRGYNHKNLNIFLSDLLQCACQSENPSLEIIKYLVGKGFLLFRRNYQQKTCLHLACANENAGHEILEYILSYKHYKWGSPLDSAGRTPLHYLFLRKKAIEMRTFTMFLKHGYRPLYSDPCSKNILHFLCQKSQNLELMKKVIELGIAVNCQTQNALYHHYEDYALKTPMHYLCQQRVVRKEVINYLIEKGADVNILDKNGCSPLFEYITSRSKQNLDLDLGVIKYFLNLGSAVMFQTKNEETLLHLICKQTETEIEEELIDLLLGLGLDLNHRDRNKNTCLSELIKKKVIPFKTIGYLIDKGLKINPTVVTQQSIVSQIIFQTAPSLELIKFLIDKGFDIHNKNLQYDMVSVACQKQKISKDNIIPIVEYLHSIGNPIDKQTLNHMQPLSWCCMRKHDDVALLEWLLGKGIDLHILDTKKNTPLHLVCRHEGAFPPIMKYLLDKDDDVNLRNIDGETPLFTYLKNRSSDPQAIKIFIEKGADLRVKDRHGNSITHVYCHNNSNNVDILKLLIENGAPIDDTNNYGVSPILKAMSSWYSEANFEVIKYLIEKGADISSRKDSFYGNTVFHYYIQKTQRNLPTIDQLYQLDEFMKLGYSWKNYNSYTRNSTISLKMVKIFLKHGASVVNVNKKLTTPLHKVCCYNKPIEKILTLFLQNGADPDHQDHLGLTPVHYLFFGQQVELKNLKVLLKFNANPNIQDKKGRTPLLYFMYYLKMMDFIGLIEKTSLY
ncbi:ankyrin repeat-containing protein [Anaeramoeba flamelloides]|uniref:Ankyrin repeat-containing protein n=1 Tax=Anaeramoeba flamelloides TaxID=1746091 RepID=A0ABQ8XBI9_9EUKA|nr:ankyrin repeat-containing protein [Anaeramoeba flamelloides]